MRSGCSAGVSWREIVSLAPESQNSLQNSLIPVNLLGDWCDQHCVASEAVRCSAKMFLILAERPANAGLSRIGQSSTRCARIYRWTRMRGQSVQRAGHILCRPILVDCITNMSGFDLLQAQEIRLPVEVIRVAGNSSLALAVP